MSDKTEHSGFRWRILARQEEKTVELEDQGLLDEVVLDDWLHLERMDVDAWWLRLGDARVLVTIAPTGAVQVDIERGAYSDVLGKTSGVVDGA